MTDKPDPLAGAAAWGAALEGKDAPVDGLDREALRKAMALNPNLRKQIGNTAAIADKLEKAAAHRPVAGKADANKNPAPVRSGNVVDSVKQLKQRHKDEQARLQQEIAKLQLQLKGVPAQTCERLVEVFVEHDPNMSSAFTSELLKMEQGFMNEIGFSVRKVIERQMRGK